MHIGNPCIHSLSCLEVSGSLPTLKRHFFGDSLFGNFEIVFISFLLSSDSVPFDVLWLTVSCSTEKNVPYTSVTIILLTEKQCL